MMLTRERCGCCPGRTAGSHERLEILRRALTILEDVRRVTDRELVPVEWIFLVDRILRTRSDMAEYISKDLQVAWMEDMQALAGEMEDAIREVQGR